MRTGLKRRVLQGAVATALTVATVALSRVPWTAEAGGRAMLRLAWRHRSALVEQCRRRSPEELAKLPQHMRREMDCDRKLQPYRLEVTIDSALTSDSVAARGATHDRPLSVFREFALAPGAHQVHIRFAPYAGSGASFALDTTLSLPARAVAVVTIDDHRMLVRR